MQAADMDCALDRPLDRPTAAAKDRALRVRAGSRHSPPILLDTVRPIDAPTSPPALPMRSDCRVILESGLFCLLRDGRKPADACSQPSEKGLWPLCEMFHLIHLSFGMPPSSCPRLPRQISVLSTACPDTVWGLGSTPQSRLGRRAELSWDG